MKKLLNSGIIIFVVILSSAFVMPNHAGDGISPDIETENFEPLLWMCNNRIILDDAIETGRVSGDDEELIERTNDYAFEGEEISWNVLVMDKNKIEQITDVVITIGGENGAGGGTQTIVTNKTSTFCGDITSKATDWQDMITLPKHNPSLGNLTSAKLSFTANLTTDIKVEHLSTSNPANFTTIVNGSVLLNYSDVSLTANVDFSQAGTATVFDGVLDFNGTSGTTFPPVSGSDSTNQFSSNLNDFIQTFPAETFDVDVDAESTFQVNGPGNYATVVLTNASAMACVTYTYQETRTIPIPGGNDIEAECIRISDYELVNNTIPASCNARILEEELEEFDPQTMAFYECTLTVETSDSMYGEYWVTVEACDSTGLCATMDENEFWFFNPIIALSIHGDLDFGVVRPGTVSYSETILLENDADDGSGVLLDMFVSGTDFYDPSSTGARCIITNRLKLGNNYVASGLDSNENECDLNFGDTSDHFCYFASNGAYSTLSDPRSDAEGYVPIVYGDDFDTDFYNDAEVMQPVGPYNPGYQPGNILTPGAEIAMTFKLGLPEPCVGDFTDGSIFFWGEAI